MADARQSPVSAHAESGADIGIDRLLRMYRQMVRIREFEQRANDLYLRALMPGRVVALLVEPGAKVGKGQPLLILEAMKMEHTMSAPANGVCEGFSVAVGDQVTENAELVQFKPD